MQTFKIAFCLLLASLLVACSHPIEIVGEGDVLSATGNRTCYLEDFKTGRDNCKKNMVVDSYLETYYAVARKGWTFSGWRNYCTDSNAPECSFDVPADTVKKNWGAVLPPLVAVFTRNAVPPPVPIPVAVYSYTVDGSGNLISPRALKGATLQRKTAYFGFTGNHAKIGFFCCKIPGLEPHRPRLDITRAPYVYKVDLAALPEDFGRERELYADLFATDGSYKGYSTLWTLEPKPSAEVVFDDGKFHIIDYTIDTGLQVHDNSVANLIEGARISTGSGQALVNSATVNLNGGEVGGRAYNYRDFNVYSGKVENIYSSGSSNIRIAGGRIESLSTFGSTLTMTNGYVGSLFIEEGYLGDTISGGAIGRLESVGGVLQITGGTFLDDVTIGYDGYATIKISGGKFNGDFLLNANGAENVGYIFSGDVRLTPFVVAASGDYESFIEGTLKDGNRVAQKIICRNASTAVPRIEDVCSGRVRIEN
jgi:hypothetical protein